MQNILAHYRVYWYSAECKGTEQAVLVQYMVYLYEAECTGTVQSNLVHYRVYWYSEECTGTGTKKICRPAASSTQCIAWYTGAVKSVLEQCIVYGYKA